MLPHGALAEPVRPLHRLLVGASSSPRHRLREGPDGGSVAGVEAGGGHRTVGYRGRGGRNLKPRSCSVRGPRGEIVVVARRGDCSEGRSRRGEIAAGRGGGEAGPCASGGRDGGVDLVGVHSSAAGRRGGAMRSRRGETSLRASGVGWGV
jgi:hypothetical protein